jgi:hypothetical protein
MIEIHLSAVLLVRDGFTGKPLEKSSVRVYMDDAILPQYRSGGYFVFTNLPSGTREVRLEGPYFQAETIVIDVPKTGYDERIISLKPNERYPFGASVTRLKLRTLKKQKPAANEPIIIAARSAFDPKIAQDDLKKGDASSKLYIRGDPAGLRLPAQFLIVDNKLSEVIVLAEILDSAGTFQAPLLAGHKRGKPLYPCAEYRLDENGALDACFRESSEIAVFHEKSKHLEIMTLTEGENEYVFEL